MTTTLYTIHENVSDIILLQEFHETKLSERKKLPCARISFPKRINVRHFNENLEAALNSTDLPPPRPQRRGSIEKISSVETLSISISPLELQRQQEIENNVGVRPPRCPTRRGSLELYPNEQCRIEEKALVVAAADTIEKPNLAHCVPSRRGSSNCFTQCKALFKASIRRNVSVSAAA